MGGAVALKVHLKQPYTWSGAILVAPMCKVVFLNLNFLQWFCIQSGFRTFNQLKSCWQIADDLVPSWLVTQILTVMAKVLPKGKLVPQKDLAEMAFRDLKKRKMVCLGTCFVFFIINVKEGSLQKKKKKHTKIDHSKG